MVKTGDRLVQVGGVDIRDLNPKQIESLLLGEEGSRVKLGFLRDAQVTSVDLVRTTLPGVAPRFNESDPSKELH